MSNERYRVFQAMRRLIPFQRRYVRGSVEIVPAVGTSGDVRPSTNTIPFPAPSDNNSGDQDPGDGDSADFNDGHLATFPCTDQYSKIEVSSAEVIGTQSAGVAVRIRDGGQDAYVGVCKRNKRKSVFTLFRIMRGRWTKLGSSYKGGPLDAGTQLRLVAVGSTIAFMENGVQRIAVGDNSLSSGMPGLMIGGTTQTDSTSVGPAEFEIHYQSTDARGVVTYDVISARNSGGPRLLRVLAPAKPVPGVAHNFLFVLPVEEGLKSTYGNGFRTLQLFAAQDKYNVTIIEPSFGIQPWYADNPNNLDVQYESFMVKELVPWVQKNLATTGDEQNWLIGFSKSGIGGQCLLLKHPDLFTLAASWDFPADMSFYNEYSPSSEACYGSDSNFQANYRLTHAFVGAHRASFLEDNRIWIGAGSVFGVDVWSYDSTLSSQGIRHSIGVPMNFPHRWDSGWVPVALDALREFSVNLSTTADFRRQRPP
jgi:hypothetical protein